MKFHHSFCDVSQFQIQLTVYMISASKLATNFKKNVETEYYEKYFWDITQRCRCLRTANIAQMHLLPEMRKLVERQLLTTFRAEYPKKGSQKPYWVFSHYLVYQIGENIDATEYCFEECVD